MNYVKQLFNLKSSIINLYLTIQLKFITTTNKQENQKREKHKLKKKTEK